MVGRRPIKLTPRDAKLLVRYLDGVDDVVSARLFAGFCPHEDHLTFLLCEMLDDNLSALNCLPYPVTKLREDLAADPKQMRVSVAIEAMRYPPNIEARLTFADLGVVVVYKDNLRPESSFERGVLFQAKKLYCSQSTGGFSLYDAFDELNTKQLFGLAKLEADEAIKKEEAANDMPWDGHFCFYLFYCPRLEAYDEQSQDDLRQYTIPSIYDVDQHHPLHYFLCPWSGSAAAGHLLEYAADPARHFPSLLASEIGWLVGKYLEKDKYGNLVYSFHGMKAKTTVREAYEHFWEEVYALSWFIVYRMLLGATGCCGSTALGIVRGQEPERNLELGSLPKYVITLTVEVGTPRG